jgi:hypothetical protein
VARVTADTIQETPTDRWIAALADPGHLYTAEQVARMIRLDRECHDVLSYQAGFDAGYQARNDELNDQYRRDVIASVQARTGLLQMIDRADVRRRADQDGRQPRPDDHRGGPVPVWDDDRPDPKFDRRPPWARY